MSMKNNTMSEDNNGGIYFDCISQFFFTPVVLESDFMVIVLLLKHILCNSVCPTHALGAQVLF